MQAINSEANVGLITELSSAELGQVSGNWRGHWYSGHFVRGSCWPWTFSHDRFIQTRCWASGFEYHTVASLITRGASEGSLPRGRRSGTSHVSGLFCAAQ